MVVNFVRAIACLLILHSWSAQALDVEVSAAHWEGYTEPSGSGVYFALIKEAFAQHSITFDVGTFARAKRRFNQDKTDILVGVYQADAQYLTRALLPRYHIDIDAPLIAIFDPKKHAIARPEDMQQKVVGWYEEYRFETFVTSDLIHYPLKDIQKGLLLLHEGRIDVIVDYAHNLDRFDLDVFATLKLADRQKLFLAFKDTPKGNALRREFDASIPRLAQTGILQQLYGEDFARLGFNF